MNYEVSFWGAAEGKNIWTRQDADRFYYETFYSNRERENGLWIEVRPSDDVLYVYYSYVIRENVLEKDSRPGSHFGLSLRLSVYCRNVFGIYEILDATFDNFFRDKLIKVNEGNTYRFLQNPQEFGKNKHTEIEQFVEKQLKNFFHEEDFVPINITHSGSSPKKVNLLDAKYYKTEIEATLANGPVFLSEKEPTRSIKQEFQKKELEISELQNGIKEKEEEMAKNKRRYEKQISDKERELEQTKKETDDSKEKLKQIKKIVEGIPLENMVVGTEETQSEPGLFRGKKDIVLAVVLTFLCCMLFYILFLRSAKLESNYEPTVIENSYNGDSLRQDSNDVAKTDSSEKH